MALLELLPAWPAFSTFLVASFAVGVAPGPGMMFAIARALGQGRMAGAVSVLGLSSGSFLLCLAAAFGVAAVIAASQWAYDLLRYAGAAYLVYLALRSLIQGGALPGRAALAESDSLGRIYRQAFVTNIMNPKSALFYLSFVPPFTDPERGSVLAQFILLGLIFNIMGNGINLVVAFFFGRIGEWLARHPRVWRGQQWFTATVFCAIAAQLLLQERR